MINTQEVVVKESESLLPLEQFEARLAQELEERAELDWSAGVTYTW